MFRSPFIYTCPKSGHVSFDCPHLLIFWRFIDKPQEDPNIRGDAFKTLIVARLAYDATEKDLESEFGRFGPIERASDPPRRNHPLLTYATIRSGLLLILMPTRSQIRRRRVTADMHLLSTRERKT